MRLLYLSQGNIPSKWAHSFQAMKMADAFAQQLGAVELLTARSLLPSGLNRVDLQRWYGISPRLRVVRLPLYLRPRESFFTHFESWRFDLAAAAYARRKRPDLVYSRSLGAALRCARAGLPSVLEAHVAPTPRWLPRLRALAELGALLRLVTVTQALREDWIRAGLPAEKICVWPDAVDLERFTESLTPQAARARLGLAIAGPLAVYCGHFYEPKGVTTLADAARRLSKGAVQLVGGWPEDIARLRARARGCEAISFAGFVPNELVPVHLAAADLLVLPNSARFPQARTTSPLKLFEYMAARRPIVATRIPALEGLLRHGENAWVVAPDSSEALAEGIEHVFSDPDLGAHMAANAWREVQRFSWQRRASEILAAVGFGRGTRSDAPCSARDA